MLSKFSVKKPFVVVVAVIIALILGGVSLTRMKTDLFPEMDLPYLAVITTDPGASAEKVEAEVTDPLEGSLASVNGVKSITSQSNDNYSLVFLEFEDDTDMDSALVKVSSAVNEVIALLPDGVGTPNYMEISADMMATMYIGAHDDDRDIYELSDLVEDKVVPALERLDGVADVSVSGGVEQSVEVRLDEAKVDGLNEDLADYVRSQFDEPLQQIADGEAQLDAAQADLDAQRAELDSYYGGAENAPDAYAPINEAQANIDAQRAELDSSRAQLDEQLDAALGQATVDALVNKDTLAQLVVAQNFAMPAGYIDDEDDAQWLLRVGENFTSAEELGDLVLATVEGIGDVRLKDVASITVINNVEDSYMRLNDDRGVLLSVYKASTASTSDVSQACVDKIEDLEKDYPGLQLDVLSDQASYISLFIDSILRSLLIGAVLAVVVLAIFLRDWRPTLIVAFSIPFSVLVALVLMYFSGLSLNVLTLGGIALAIGMLVDNSIIVLENIYRLRGRGISAPRAAVQGAKQITGAVVASTLTTICVFLPAIFTTGLVNQMLVPFALTIAYALTASLVVALTLVPSLSAFVFKNYKPRKEGWFEHLKDGYGRSLAFFLRHKTVPLLVAVGLLAGAIATTVSTGINLIPSMTSKTISVTVTVPEDATRDEAYALADDVMEAALTIDGVEFVGAMDGTSGLSLMTSAADGAGKGEVPETFMFFIQADDTVETEDQVTKIVDELNKKTRKLDGEVRANASSSEGMTSMLGSGLTITIKGDDQQTLTEISEDIMALVDEVDGYTEISNGLEEASPELRLIVDRSKLAREGVTSAQLYQALSAALSTEVDSATIEVDGTSMQVTIVDDTELPTKEDLLDTVVQVGDTELRLRDVATVEEGTAANTIVHVDSSRTMDVTAEVEDGENNALLSRELTEKLDGYDLPDGYTIEYGGEIENVNTMLEQMGLMALLGLVLIYLIMVAQFQSLLSPFIVIFTVPLAFTGGFLGLILLGEQLDILSLMGFLVLMGTVVNNGIVLVDYVNQLRRGGLEKRDALVAAGRTRMRPIIMTALTTVLSMIPLVVSQSVGGSMQRGMAIVVVGGMIYATFMTLYIVPIMYDILYRRTPSEVDLGDENLEEDPGDAQAYLEELAAQRAAAEAEAQAQEQARTERPAQAVPVQPALPQGRNGVPGAPIPPDPRPDRR